jgi:predicted PurR-regulated permease PerM
VGVATDSDPRAAIRRAPNSLLTAGLVCGSIILIAAVVALVVLLLVRLGPVTMAVVVALLLAALTMPAVDALTRRRVPRAVAALLGVLGLLAVLLGPLVLVGLQVSSQLGDLGTRLDEGVNRVRDWLTSALPVSQQQLDQVSQQARDFGRSAAANPASGVSMAVEAIGAAVLALVLLFFLLKDGHRMWDWFVGRLPSRHRDRAEAAGSAGWHALSGYVRGIVIVAAVDAIGIGAALFIVGVPLALPLALLTFVAAFVPIIGATVAGAAAVLVALVANGPVQALIILGAVIAVQQAEGNLLEPLVMGRAVRLHPAAILVAVAAGTVLGGIAGALVSVPLLAVTYRVITSLTRDRSETPPPEAAPVTATDGHATPTPANNPTPP